MERIKALCIMFWVSFFALFMLTVSVQAQEYEKVNISISECLKYKAFYDDQRPYLKDFYKKVLPPKLYTQLTYNVEDMKKLWAEVVGFKAPDVVGKIAPEIKPGKYTYKDKEKYPGLKELMIPLQYSKRFDEGKPPFGGNFPEITVIPTRQYYYGLPIAEATKNNAGRAKTDDKGYLIDDSYVSGLPFPRPDGKFKARQIVYNWIKRYLYWENYYFVSLGKGLNKHFRTDNEGSSVNNVLRLNGRCQVKPYGWFDERARANQELYIRIFEMLAPRDQFGNIFYVSYYVDPNKSDNTLFYVNALRRIRKLSSTDTQDTIGGGDVIQDDGEMFAQKLSPTVNPYECELVAEREFLVPALSIDGSFAISSKDFTYVGLEFERRPLYVVKMTQKDKNYIYSYRMLYIDKETHLIVSIENYDQKGRLYRTGDAHNMFIPEMGTITMGREIYRDYLDLHTTLQHSFSIPAPWFDRSDMDLGAAIKKGAK
jgi:hypothetical protein